MPQEADKPLVFLRSDSREHRDDRPFVAIVKSRDELNRWLRHASPALCWIQVEELLSDPEAWAFATQGPSDIPLDVVLSAPGSQFADLYRLVDVLAVRDVRVSMPATPNFLKAIKLATSLGLPVRLLPGQPSAAAVEELAAALDLYLHHPMVETPIEFFHSALAWMRGAQTGSLWFMLEHDPAKFRNSDLDNRMGLPASGSLSEDVSMRDFVSKHLSNLINERAECATCPWQQLCQGYFKSPDPTYSCHGVKGLFATLRTAADEIERDLATCEAQPA